MLKSPFKQSSQFWIHFCWLFVDHYQEISKLSKTFVKSTISPKLPNLEKGLSLSFSKFVKTAQTLSIEMSVVKLSYGMGSSTEVTSVMNVFCLVCCISVKETHLSECVSLLHFCEGDTLVWMCFFVFACSEIKWWRLRRCSECPTRCRVQRRPSSWASWLGPEVLHTGAALWGGYLMAWLVGWLVGWLVCQ